MCWFMLEIKLGERSEHRDRQKLRHGAFPDSPEGPPLLCHVSMSTNRGLQILGLAVFWFGVYSLHKITDSSGGKLGDSSGYRWGQNVDTRILEMSSSSFSNCLYGGLIPSHSLISLPNKEDLNVSCWPSTSSSKPHFQTQNGLSCWLKAALGAHSPQPTVSGEAAQLEPA